MVILLPNTMALAMPADGHAYLVYDAQHPFEAAHAAAEVLVLWGNSAINLQSAVRDLPNVRLVQTLAAGPERAETPGLPRFSACKPSNTSDFQAPRPLKSILKSKTII